MSRRIASVVATAALIAGVSQILAADMAQPPLDPATILHPPPDSWPTYSGDYSGQRYSPLKQINQSNVSHLKLAFTSKLTFGAQGAILGGDGTWTAGGFPPAVRGAVLKVGDVLYTTAPDNAWAVDARSGRVLWHFFWRTRGGTHIGNRGPGIWHDTLLFETPDDYLIALDIKTGQEKWHATIASFEEQHFSTTAPIVIGDHVMVGTGDDIDEPGFLQSFDPQTGKLQWRTYMVPMNPGDPGLDTWKDLDAARHGGGEPWTPGSYDPETNLYIIGTGNPTPAYFANARGNKDALFTCSLVAIDVSTGKMKWYYQTSPNDTHDWDSAQTPVLADIRFNGKLRKVAMTAARNGYFFVVDRTTGEHLVTGKFSDTVNWAYPQLNAKGQPVRIPEKDHSIGGSLVSASNPGSANWQPPSYSPQYGLFYVPVTESWSMYYTTETDPRGGMGLGGKEEIALTEERYIKAIDPRTGKIVWSRHLPHVPGAPRRRDNTGLLTTAGRLLFAADVAGNFVARDPGTGKPLWHAPLANISSAPETYLLDGKQYVLVAAGDTLNGFALP